MDTSELIQQRLHNQHIAGAGLETPRAVVAWHGAVQAQDYLGALWAVGLRMKQAVESNVEQALADKTIVRTWPMRGTLHFVPAEDVRWMLELFAPRVIAASARRHRELGLDEDVLARSRDVMTQALQGGRQLTRSEMGAALELAGIATTGQRLYHILWRLGLEGLICFGVRAGKQQTFVLLDEWLPVTKQLAREDALAKLTRHYFVSHGPATDRDFAWWSGLPLGEARSGLELAGPHLASVDIDGQTCWLSSSSMPIADDISAAAWLLPAYDEYTVGYTDRSALLDADGAKYVEAGHSILLPTIVIGGVIAGTWRRTITPRAVDIELNPFAPLSHNDAGLVEMAALRYGSFLGLPVKVKTQ